MKGTKKNNSNVPPSNTNEILASSILNSPTWCSSPSDTSLVAPNPKYQDKNYDEQEDKSHHSFFSILRMVSSIAFREATRQKGHYFLGFGMIFLVVYIISLLITIGSYSPLVFMEMGEGSQGEIDFVLTPSSSNEAGALNYTRIEGLLPNAFHSPRPNNVIVQMYPASSCSSFDADDPFNPTYPYTYSSSCQRTEHCLAYLCNRLSMSASLYLVDSNKERKATIGRTWTYPTLPPNHVVIDQTFAYSLGVAKNDYLFMVFPLKSSSLKYFYNEALNEVRASNPSFSMPSYVSTYVVVPVIVHDVVTSSMGKFAATERNFIVMEYATILNVLAKHLHVDVPYSFRYSLDQTSKFVYHQVDSVLFSKSVPRFSTYLIRDFPTLARNLLDWGNELQRTVGPTDSQSTFPVLNELYDLNQVSMFIDLFIQLLILFLGSLSVFLIYSLLMTSIETKIFHFGIVRMVGMTRLVLISMLVIQALFYSIPASVVGLICSELSFIFLKGFLEDYLRFTFDPFLTLSAVLVSFSLALLVPLLSSIAPIRLALSHHLHEALSRNRLTISSTTMITIIDPKKDNQKIFYLCVGVILSAFGFSVYYFLPKALVNNDLVLLLNIFLFILISLIFGLVVLADNFIKVVQSIVFGFIFTLLFMENHAVRVLVRSNLLIHRVRNRKTALIYSLGLAFIIFISVTTKVQLDTLQYNYRRIVGADIIAYSDSYYSDGTPASVSNSKQLTSFLSSHDWVVDVAWQTWALDKVSSEFKSTTISNIGQLQSFPSTIYGISSNFLELMDPIHLSPPSPVSPISLLYSSTQTNPVMLGAFFKTSFYLSPGDPLLFCIGIGSTIVKVLMYPIFYATSSPVFTMTDINLEKKDVLVSMPTFLNLTQGRFSSVSELPLKACYIKVVSGLTDSQFNKFISSLQSYLSYESIRDIRSTLSFSDNGRKVMDIIFQIAMAMIMLFTFFSLNTSMMANIFEQSKEIGIIRALGLTKWATFRIYFYESLILVVSSVFLGCCVGVIVAVTMTLQQSSLTQVQLEPSFNWTMLLSVIGLSILSAIFSTFAPVRLIVFKKSLTSLLRD